MTIEGNPLLLQHIANKFAITSLNSAAVANNNFPPAEQDNVVIEEHEVSDDGGSHLLPRGEPEKNPVQAKPAQNDSGILEGKEVSAPTSPDTPAVSVPPPPPTAASTPIVDEENPTTSTSGPKKADHSKKETPG